MMTVEVDGWVITFYNDCEMLDYCGSVTGRANTIPTMNRFASKLPTPLQSVIAPRLNYQLGKLH
jgi:hypothetical protein